MTTPTKNPRPGPRRRHNDDDWERTGETLRQLRIDRDITQSKLATAIGFVNPGSIAQIEKGLKPLTDGKLIAAAKFLNVSPLAIRRPQDFEEAS